MTTVLSALLDITLFSAILFAAILIFQRLFRRRISAAMHCAVWALLILRLMVPVTVESDWHLVTVPQQAIQTIQAQEPSAPDTTEGIAAPSSGVPQTDKNMIPSKLLRQASPTANQSVTSVSAKPVDWQTIVVLIWAAGAFGLMTYTTLQWLRLNRQISHGSIQIPKSVLDILKNEKSTLHIHRNIRVCGLNWLVSPALSASLRPTLLLPASLLHDTDALRFGIRHELTHYKRKDHLLSLLLLVLRCLYWFNPIVWVAFRRIQTDIETACDAAVTARMAECERTRYIHTMIDMGRSSKPLYALGMGAGNGRKALEKRVRGMFMTKRTGLTAKMAAILLAMLLFVTCFTTACQPTPETPIVVNKNEGVLEAAVAATPAPAEKYKAPETLTMEPFTVGDKLTVNVDATVDIPDVDTFPVYEFLPAVYTQLQIDALRDYFYKDETLFNRGNRWTKSEFEQKIVELKKIKQEILDGATNKAGNAKYEMSAEEVQENIDMMEKDMQDAPETVDTSAWDGTFTTQEHGDVVFKGFSVTPDLAQEKTQFFNASVYEKLNSSNLMLLNGNRYYPSFNQSPDMQAEGIKTTPEQAVEIAQKMLTACGFDFMVPVGAYAGEIVDSEEGLSSSTSGGYAVKCVRRVGDFFVTSASNGVTVDMSRSNLTSDEMNAAYANQWDPEVLTVCVDDTGITSVEWQSFGDIGATLSENVTLLPFDELGTYIKNGISAYYGWNKDTMGGEEMKREINISHIELSMARIQIKDHSEKWELVPVFEIYGTSTLWNEADNIPANKKVMTQNYLGYTSGFLSGSLLTINAIDGSAVKIY